MANNYFQLHAPYVDPPPAGYYYPNKDAPRGYSSVANDVFDDKPWYWNEGKEGTSRDRLSRFTSASAVGMWDGPLSPQPNVVNFQTWLVVVDKSGNFVAWAGVGFSWTITSTADNKVGAISNLRALTGQPAAANLPSALFPPKPPG
jgi:hypothetical protein